MSVETSYFIVDWAKLQGMAPDADLVEHFILGPDGHGNSGDSDVAEEAFDAGEGDEFEADETGPQWQAEGARALEFGDYDYYFQSWGFSTEFSDWLRPLRCQLDERVERPFAQLFKDIGIVFDDDYGPTAIKSGVAFSDSSLIATISPDDVASLRALVRGIDRAGLEREFGRMLTKRPCPGLPNGDVVVEWLDALDRALAGIAPGEGILVLAPA